MPTALRAVLARLQEQPDRAQVDFDPEEMLRDLLQAMLTPIRRARETPLQFEIDSDRIVHAALYGLFGAAPESLDNHGGDREIVLAALDDLVAGILGLEQPVPPSGSEGDSLAAWLTRLFTRLRAVDHRAFGILALRIEGFQDRDIATKLGTGLRLVQRIAGEIRLNWKEIGAPG